MTPGVGPSDPQPPPIIPPASNANNADQQGVEEWQPGIDGNVSYHTNREAPPMVPPVVLPVAPQILLPQAHITSSMLDNLQLQIDHMRALLPPVQPLHEVQPWIPMAQRLNHGPGDLRNSHLSRRASEALAGAHSVDLRSQMRSRNQEDLRNTLSRRNSDVPEPQLHPEDLRAVLSSRRDYLAEDA